MNDIFEERRDTPLASKIKRQINENGCLSVARYMEMCLYDPEYGYYIKQPILGGKGDFITAPEISQIFGELIGLWCSVVWEQMKSPGRLNLVELGPGRGTLMLDVLRAARINSKFSRALSVHLVEMSPILEKIQKETLKETHFNLTWHEILKTVPDGPTILIANEFLDTFPVNQNIFDGDTWFERLVGTEDQKRLVFLVKDKNGEIISKLSGDGILKIQESQDHTKILQELSTRILKHPLAALFIDYGYEKPTFGETLQAIRVHTPEHPLCSPGEADLSAQVDFACFKSQAINYGFEIDGPLSQSDFLLHLGIVERCSRLMKDNPLKAAQIEGDVMRLISANGMGIRFKVICLRTANLPKLINS
ncbi:MAG: class I SAM-dependent methyltransferase [Hyphomicrobium sp.]